jgi:phospholipase A-2-activating protein
MLLHPCQTVWSVAGLPNGDIVTGGSDGRVRVWTQEASRVAKEDILQVH